MDNKKSTKPKTERELSIVELIKANNILNQNCVALSNHVNKCELDINSLYHQNMHLKNEIVGLKSVIEVFAMKMGIEKELFDQSMPAPSPKKKVQKEKSLPLHDDLTVRCPACSVVNNRDFKLCHKCGYQNK